MPRILVGRKSLPTLERALEPSRLQEDLLVQAYELVTPVLRRSLPPLNRANLQENTCRGLDGPRAAMGGHSA